MTNVYKFNETCLSSFYSEYSEKNPTSEKGPDKIVSVQNFDVNESDLSEPDEVEKQIDEYVSEDETTDNEWSKRTLVDKVFMGRRYNFDKQKIDEQNSQMSKISDQNLKEKHFDREESFQ